MTNHAVYPKLIILSYWNTPSVWYFILTSEAFLRIFVVMMDCCVVRFVCPTLTIFTKRSDAEEAPNHTKEKE